MSSYSDDSTGVTAVLQDRRTYRYGAHAAEADYLPHIAAVGAKTAAACDDASESLLQDIDD